MSVITKQVTPEVVRVHDLKAQSVQAVRVRYRTTRREKGMDDAYLSVAGARFGARQNHCAEVESRKQCCGEISGLAVSFYIYFLFRREQATSQ